MANISTRGFVQTADKVMIGGFINQGATPMKVLLRAIGPSLAQFGVDGVLANPVLELHQPDGLVVQTMTGRRHRKRISRRPASRLRMNWNQPSWSHCRSVKAPIPQSTRGQRQHRYWSGRSLFWRSLSGEIMPVIDTKDEAAPSWVLTLGVARISHRAAACASWSHG